MKEYEIGMEVAGKFAIFAQPDSGSEQMTYMCPPWSAAKGMFEEMFFLRHAIVWPKRVHICEPIRYVSIGFNYHAGVLRKPDQIKGGSALQRRMCVLMNVRYQLFADVKNLGSSDSQRVANEASKKFITLNHAHSYKEQFNRHLRRGCRRIHFGHSEFMATYVGPILPTTRVCTELSTVLPSMLVSPFPKAQFSDKVDPIFAQNVKIVNGVLDYAQLPLPSF